MALLQKNLYDLSIRVLEFQQHEHENSGGAGDSKEEGCGQYTKKSKCNSNDCFWDKRAGTCEAPVISAIDSCTDQNREFEKKPFAATMCATLTDTVSGSDCVWNASMKKCHVHSCKVFANKKECAAGGVRTKSGVEEQACFWKKGRCQSRL